jgi:hypothetical protein
MTPTREMLALKATSDALRIGRERRSDIGIQDTKLRSGLEMGPLQFLCVSKLFATV